MLSCVEVCCVTLNCVVLRCVVLCCVVLLCLLNALVVMLSPKDCEWFIISSEFQHIYDRLGVTIIERGESFYQPMMPGVVKDLDDKGKTLSLCPPVSRIWQIVL